MPKRFRSHLSVTRTPIEAMDTRTGRCFRCGRERPVAELTTVPPNAPPGVTRIVVCRDGCGAGTGGPDEQG